MVAASRPRRSGAVASPGSAAMQTASRAASVSPLPPALRTAAARAWATGSAQVLVVGVEMAGSAIGGLGARGRGLRGGSRGGFRHAHRRGR